MTKFKTLKEMKEFATYRLINSIKEEIFDDIFEYSEFRRTNTTCKGIEFDITMNELYKYNITIFTDEIILKHKEYTRHFHLNNYKHPETLVDVILCWIL